MTTRASRDRSLKCLPIVSLFFRERRIGTVGVISSSDQMSHSHCALFFLCHRLSVCVCVCVTTRSLTEELTLW